MAVIREITKRSLVINVEDGVTAGGTVKLKPRTYSGVRSEATAEGMYAAGAALAGLMDSAAGSITVTEKSTLLEEAA